jgi:hypothetical protein
MLMGAKCARCNYQIQYFENIHDVRLEDMIFEVPVEGAQKGEAVQPKSASV